MLKTLITVAALACCSTLALAEDATHSLSIVAPVADNLHPFQGGTSPVFTVTAGIPATPLNAAESSSIRGAWRLNTPGVTDKQVGGPNEVFAERGPVLEGGWIIVHVCPGVGIGGSACLP